MKSKLIHTEGQKKPGITYTRSTIKLMDDFPVATEEGRKTAITYCVECQAKSEHSK